MVASPKSPFFITQTHVRDALIEAAERVNKLAVQKAQMTARLHGDNLYRDYMPPWERELDEAFQAHYDVIRNAGGE